tara:strand:+ start:1204 stop:3477 length:2274 start_codon:yes stop_codon:yes gene_type:complete
MCFVNEELLNKNKVLNLLVAFAFIDDELHPREVEALEKICNDLGISQDDLGKIIGLYEGHRGCKDYEDLCYEALEDFGNVKYKQELAELVCYIATSDNFHHEKELKLINTLRDVWGVEVSIAKNLEWDGQQDKVILSKYDKRILCHAGPGMGKTAVACARVSNLIKQGVEPSNIWMLSFTRTAVKEIRDRISSFAGQNLSSLGVKVATIDSQSWHVRYGLTDEEIKKLFGDYDQNIEAVSEMFEKNYEKMHEFFDDFEHIIIDEAQDITGARAELIIKILQILNPECGFTIFADPAQAIYNFTDDVSSQAREEEETFLDMVKDKFSDTLEEIELHTIHRTTNPKIVKIIEDLRLDIYVNDNVDQTAFDQRFSFVKEQADEQIGAFKTSDVQNSTGDTLVLFRRRSEVLQASAFASNDRVPHRIRMSGFQANLFSWIGYIFYDYTEDTISKDKFLELCVKREYLFADHVEGRHSFLDWWLLLKMSMGTNNDIISISGLRAKLARTPPHINLCYSELGMKGAILGTIHASKGREAEKVILELPPQIGSKEANLDEESRVLYVGATRAKNILAVGSGYTTHAFSSRSISGRSFLRPRRRQNNNNSISLQIEIGRDNDVDEYSFVSKNFNKEDVIFFQRHLSTLANRVPFPLRANVDPDNKFIYKITPSSGGEFIDKPFGFFNQSFNQDLFDIAGRYGSFKPPPYIEPFYLIGVRTVCKSDSDPNLKHLYEPYSSTGIWLAPIVIGFPTCPFFRYRSRRRG